MAQVSTAAPKEGFGATMRRDLWWAGPLATFLGLLAFLIYANYIIFFVPGYFEVRQDKEHFDAPNNPAVAPYLLELGRRTSTDDKPDRLRLRADLLLRAVQDLARTSAARFHGDTEGSADDLLRAYARDHLRD